MINKKNSRSRIYFFLIFVLLLSILFILFGNSFVLASTPKIISKLNDAFENIEKWLVKLSTPAAAVAVGVGIFMKKFSFGDEERIRMSKKIIRGSLFGYAFILALDLILAAIKSFV